VGIQNNCNGHINTKGQASIPYVEYTSIKIIILSGVRNVFALPTRPFAPGSLGWGCVRLARPKRITVSWHNNTIIVPAIINVPPKLLLVALGFIQTHGGGGGGQTFFFTPP
jgi:hypothetical protein